VELKVHFPIQLMGILIDCLGLKNLPCNNRKRTTRQFPLFFVSQSGILPHPAKHLGLLYGILKGVVRVARSAFEFSPNAA
jgi:hypothetical protein